MRQYLQKFGRQSGLEARLQVTANVATALGPESEIQLLRVVQEALTNVRKHAEASSAVVRLDNKEEWLRILIEETLKLEETRFRETLERGRYPLAVLHVTMPGSAVDVTTLEVYPPTGYWSSSRTRVGTSRIRRYLPHGVLFMPFGTQVFAVTTGQ